jgi:histone acetyltransferase (RNA polymerase elongator complex component)
MTIDHSFEQGPIRPPSEAKSLLIRVTRNCPWNKCAFCHTYQGCKFEFRPVVDIRKDIEAARGIAEEIRALSWKAGKGGRVSRAVVAAVFSNDHLYGDAFRSVAAWLYYGGDSVFLQDADSLILKTDDLLEVLRFIRDAFPQVSRITSYCRSKTAKRKSVEELRKLHEAGLSRIHIGLESGSDPVLQSIRKGVTAAEHIEGGKHVVASGISLCEYVMPGLGGDRWSKGHAVETARVLNEINPDFIRLRSLQVRRGTALYDSMKKGDFRPLGDEDVLREIRLFIEQLEGISSTLISDHILNLLEELEGRLPEDKEKMLTTIDRYFALPDEDRMIYRLGRRRGIYRRMDDLSDPEVYDRLKAVVARYAAENPGQMDRDLDQIRQNFI